MAVDWMSTSGTSTGVEPTLLIRNIPLGVPSKLSRIPAKLI